MSHECWQEEQEDLSWYLCFQAYEYCTLALYNAATMAQVVSGTCMSYNAAESVLKQVDRGLSVSIDEIKEKLSEEDDIAAVCCFGAEWGLLMFEH
jgi:hypothetical protein